MIRVAAYCRVSTDQEDQANSFEAQQRYFREYIQNNPDWELYKIYADEGITGTSTKKRTEFNQMIRDACDGKFQWILTKEVSRFSRNILDTIAYTRQLRNRGVGVRFALDGIDTLQPDAELYLSIMASMAQEESRKTSSRVVWGQTRQMERGVVFGRSLLGYTVSKGKLHIEPDGAGLVQRIFRMYAIEQVSTVQIAQHLTEEGVPTPGGSPQWRANTIIKILNNEKYVGDLVQKKTYTPDYLTHEKRANKGQVPMIRLENHHSPIVSRELWDLAQERLRRNNKHSGKQEGHSNRYVFSGKIRCAQCGSSFVGRGKTRKDGTRIRRWCCGNRARGGERQCTNSCSIRDCDGLELLKTGLRNLPMDIEAVQNQVVELALSGILSDTDSPNKLEASLKQIRKKKETILDLYCSGTLSKDDLQDMMEHYELQRNALEERIREQKFPDLPALASAIRTEIQALLSGASESTVLYKSLLDCLTVYPNGWAELQISHLPMVFRFQKTGKQSCAEL